MPIRSTWNRCNSCRNISKISTSSRRPSPSPFHIQYGSPRCIARHKPLPLCTRSVFQVCRVYEISREATGGKGGTNKVVSPFRESAVKFTYFSSRYRNGVRTKKEKQGNEKIREYARSWKRPEGMTKGVRRCEAGARLKDCTRTEFQACAQYLLGISSRHISVVTRRIPAPEQSPHRPYPRQPLDTRRYFICRALLAGCRFFLSCVHRNFSPRHCATPRFHTQLSFSLFLSFLAYLYFSFALLLPFPSLVSLFFFQLSFAQFSIQKRR